MCGIFGLFAGTGHQLSSDRIETLIKDLFHLSETRGREAAGLAVKTGGIIKVYKEALSAAKMLKTKEYKRFERKTISPLKRGTPFSMIGHTRLVTNGLQAITKNNQPVVKNDYVVVHNGIIINEEDIWAKTPSLNRQTQVDSEIIPSLVHHHVDKGENLISAVTRTYRQIKGETSIAMFCAQHDNVILATNTGSLYVIHFPDEHLFVFVSENYIARQFLEGFENAGKPPEIIQIPANALLVMDIKALQPHHIKMNAKNPIKNVNISPNLATQNKIESRDLLLEEKRKSMRRCSKCLLPETMPFIAYNTKGICNYCENYRPQQLSTSEELESTLSQYRSSTGEADCLIAFSGGRDSSYGLHLLKEEYGMNPMAYTYDWGMVTPLARRNQAKMCGHLGVEHIWVSADIKRKRQNVRMNVEAWMKKPHLGMVPLFMAGDKQFFYHANQVMEQTEINLMVFCMNNLERTDFKYGFAGVPPGFFDHRSYGISSLNKARILGFYGKEFLTNPRYINTSLIDTFTGFISWYMLNHDYVYLFNHLEWKEEVCDEILLGQYDWEIAKDSPSTWRIGDGTAAFYNYIYHTVTGFTEFDTFRSNQIREGFIKRAWAIEQIEQENIPRWESMREYLQLIQVDFDEAIRCIDSIPKLYENL